MDDHGWIDIRASTGIDEVNDMDALMGALCSDCSDSCIHPYGGVSRLSLMVYVSETIAMKMLKKALALLLAILVE